MFTFKNLITNPTYEKMIARVSELEKNTNPNALDIASNYYELAGYVLNNIPLVKEKMPCYFLAIKLYWNCYQADPYYKDVSVKLGLTLSNDNDSQSLLSNIVKSKTVINIEDIRKISKKLATFDLKFSQQDLYMLIGLNYLSGLSVTQSDRTAIKFFMAAEKPNFIQHLLKMKRGLISKLDGLDEITPLTLENIRNKHQKNIESLLTKVLDAKDLLNLIQAISDNPFFVQKEKIVWYEKIYQHHYAVNPDQVELEDFSNEAKEAQALLLYQLMLAKCDNFRIDGNIRSLNKQLLEIELSFQQIVQILLDHPIIETAAKALHHFHMYLFGTMQNNRQHLLSTLIDAKNQSFPWVNYSLGIWYLTKSPNRSIGTEYIITAAEQGYVPAIFERGWRLLNLIGHNRQSPSYIQQAAEAGNTKAEYYSGYIYEFGGAIGPEFRDVSKIDLKQAVHWYKKAAAKNNPKAIEAITRIKATLKNQLKQEIINNNLNNLQKIEQQLDEDTILSSTEKKQFFEALFQEYFSFGPETSPSRARMFPPITNHAKEFIAYQYIHWLCEDYNANQEHRDVKYVFQKMDSVASVMSNDTTYYRDAISDFFDFQQKLLLIAPEVIAELYKFDNRDIAQSATKAVLEELKSRESKSKEQRLPFESPSPTKLEKLINAKADEIKRSIIYVKLFGEEFIPGTSDIKKHHKSYQVASALSPKSEGKTS